MAVLLACSREPEQIEERPEREEVLARFERAQLEEAVLQWAAAHRIAGKTQEWNAYLSDLMEQHRRKHTLMPRLKELQD